MGRLRHLRQGGGLPRALIRDERARVPRADSGTRFHVATADEVAEVVAFLASDAGAPVTGNVIALR